MGITVHLTLFQHLQEHLTNCCSALATERKVTRQVMSPFVLLHQWMVHALCRKGASELDLIPCYWAASSCAKHIPEFIWLCRGLLVGLVSPTSLSRREASGWRLEHRHGGAEFRPSAEWLSESRLLTTADGSDWEGARKHCVPVCLPETLWKRKDTERLKIEGSPNTFLRYNLQTIFSDLNVIN